MFLRSSLFVLFTVLISFFNSIVSSSNVRDDQIQFIDQINYPLMNDHSMDSTFKTTSIKIPHSDHRSLSTVSYLNDFFFYSPHFLLNISQ